MNKKYLPRWRWPGAGKVLEKIIVPFTLLTVLFILTGGVYINLFIFQVMIATFSFLKEI